MQPSPPKLPPAPAAPLDPVSVIPSNASVINPATPAEGTGVPSYFSGNSAPELVSDYREDGHNWRQANAMLDASVFSVCKHGGGCCELMKSKVRKMVQKADDFDGDVEEVVEALTAYPSFKMLSMRRLENVELFERFSHRERQVERAMIASPPPSWAHPEQRAQANLFGGVGDLFVPDTPEWLKKLGERNGLSKIANTHYLLHGTTHANLKSIVRDGLRTKFCDSSNNLYGKGLYFADAACKASQYCNISGDENIILVCRVIVGRSFPLHRPAVDWHFAPEGFHSTRVQAGVTCKKGCATGTCTAKCLQLHNEIIVYNDCDVYPEFVLGHTSPIARHLSEHGLCIAA